MLARMRTLILFRHAKAVRAHEAPDDKSRELTGRGRREAALAGAAMEGAGLKPALGLVSTAARTRETAKYGLANFELEVRFEEALYHASPEGIWDAFASSDAESVAIVGHNPGIGELVSMLVHQAHDGSKLARELGGHFPTAAFAAFEIRGGLMGAAGPSLITAWKPDRRGDD
jgi:phosphohistidine phosphatase